MIELGYSRERMLEDIQASGGATPVERLTDPGSFTDFVTRDQARLLVLRAAAMMDTVGNKAARSEIAQIKVAVPAMTLRVLDRAIQVHGGGGVSQEFWLAAAWAHSRTLRLADGPDEVHRRQIGRLELRKHA